MLSYIESIKKPYVDISETDAGSNVHLLRTTPNVVELVEADSGRVFYATLETDGWRRRIREFKHRWVLRVTACAYPEHSQQTVI